MDTLQRKVIGYWHYCEHLSRSYSISFCVPWFASTSSQYFALTKYNTSNKHEILIIFIADFDNPTVRSTCQLTGETKMLFPQKKSKGLTRVKDKGSFRPAAISRGHWAGQEQEGPPGLKTRMDFLVQLRFFRLNPLEVMKSR